MKPINQIIATLFVPGIALPAIAQRVLPFPEPVSASVAGKTLADSTHQWRKAENHLPAFDVGVDLGSPVALDYYDSAPFKFNGSIEKIDIKYIN